MTACPKVSHVTPPPSLFPADDFASYFIEKIEAIKRGLPQTSTTAPTHLQASAHSFSALPICYMDEQSILLAKASSYTCVYMRALSFSPPTILPSLILRQILSLYWTIPICT